MTGHAQGTHIFPPDDNLLQTTKVINMRNDTITVDNYKG